MVDRQPNLFVDKKSNKVIGGRFMKKILITGGAGFIGVHLAQRFATLGYHTTLVDNLRRGVLDSELESLLQRPEIEFAQINLLEPEALSQLPDDYTHIVHLAAIIGVKHVMQSPFETLADNISMVRNIVAFSHRQNALERFAFASTSEIHAGRLEHFDLPVPTREDVALGLSDISNPRTSYAMSKIVGESLCHYSGLPFVIFRPHNIYGPRMGQSHVIPNKLAQIYEASDGDTVEVPSADHTRTFCYIDDAVDMLVEMIFNPACANQTFNLGAQSEEIKIGDLVSICAEVVGRTINLKALDATTGSPSRRCPDMSMVTEKTGVTAKTSLRQGVTSTFSWYRKTLFGSEGLSAD